MSEAADRLRAQLAERAQHGTKWTDWTKPAREGDSVHCVHSVHDGANATGAARQTYRERVKAAMLPLHRVDPRLAEAIRDAWMERIAIIAADGGDPIEAERIACEQAEREADTLRSESVDEWAGRVIHDDLDGRGERNLF